MEDLKVLRQKRGSLKSRLTAFKNYLERTSNLESLNEVKILELERKIVSAERLSGEFAEVQDQIELSVENAEAEYPERETFEDILDFELATAKHLWNKAKGCDGETGTGTDAGSVVAVSEQGSGILAGNIKLPRIELPKFDGNYERWLEFRDTYDSLIHKSANITEIEKFHYLRASVQGEASQVLRGIEFSGANYENAYKALLERYNNERLLVHSHVKAIFSMETLRRESGLDIRRLIDETSKHLQCLSQLNENIEHWDTLLIHIVVSKLDQISAREWERYTHDKDSKGEKTNFENLKEFLRRRATFLETIEAKVGETNSDKKGIQNYKGSFKGSYKGTGVNTRGLLANNNKCVVCSMEHSIQGCNEFGKLSVNDRISKVKALKLCINCLSPGHFSRECHGKSCKMCNGKHHGLLHIPREVSSTYSKPENSTQLNSNAGVAVTLASQVESYVLLSTANIGVRDNCKRQHVIRAILDSGSQSSYITEDLCKRLKLTKTEIDMEVFGINNSLSNVKERCEVELNSLHNGFRKKITCLILPEITGEVPSMRLAELRHDIPVNIRLADPEFYLPSKIQMLIGAELFYDLLCVGRIKLGKNKPVLQKSILGWIVSGPMPVGSNNSTYCNFAREQKRDRTIDEHMSRFWEIEECGVNEVWSSEEQACEESFFRTTTRDNEGRFVVSIPFKGDVKKLGDSKVQAMRRFSAMERKLCRDDTLRVRYVNFMREYKGLGHMTKLKMNDKQEERCTYYMPHHGVVKEQNLTTKLRVVFDASAPTTSGLSLNDLQAVGPVVQDDLLAIVLRFRFHRFVISADIEKMYRQVWVKPEERQFQRILWRENADEPLDTYELNTVTYGTSSASYLATRCILQLALDHNETAPQASKVLRHDFYVDDLLTGFDECKEAVRVGRCVSEILREAGFNLRKWQSNDQEILDEINEGEAGENLVKLGSNENCKTLCIVWCSEQDSLKYEIDCGMKGQPVTKRAMLSQISQIFDPLGLVGPCIIVAKMLIQKLWMMKLTWDEAVPGDIYTSWTRLQSEFGLLKDLSINRRVLSATGYKEIELHGFSDASESAYAGCLFVRSKGADGRVFTSLLCAKSRVAPVKTLSVPRLELCGALLLAKIFEKVMKSTDVNFVSCTLWSDSSIVLGWLNSQPNALKTFVANRVAKIQHITEGCLWRHVPSNKNPADILSRGVYPSQLLKMDLWWKGPNFLSDEREKWPKSEWVVTSLPEVRMLTAQSLLVTNLEKCLISRFSELRTLKRVFAYMIRFVSRCNKDFRRRHGESFSGELSLDEIETGFMILVRLAQRETFKTECEALIGGKGISGSSPVLKLAPFIDKNNTLRVGGRLANSSYAEDKRYPILLHARHSLSKLIVEYEHKRLGHAGPLLLLSSLREQFWIVSGRNLVRGVVRKCVTCFRHNSKVVCPMMGNIPKMRLEANLPFEIVGVDYAGPFLIKDRKGRGAKVSKCYICLFVCFTTKALHLELVSDLTTECFILSLRRFAARRGKPSHIYSDNGRNFVGANSELKDLSAFLNNNERDIIKSCQDDCIDWHFIPAHSLHFGGLWEAGVKSVKYHLKRIMGNSHLTFEQFYSLLIQVEAILNSRPICPLSNDPNDLQPLTPAHFLVGKPLTQVPDPDLSGVKESRMNLYQRIQGLRQHFWRRWSKEYVGELQQRTKWRQSADNLSVGAMVLVKDDGAPPMKWKLGRVVKVYSGPDNVVRVADVKTHSGIIKRSCRGLCPLPVT